MKIDTTGYKSYINSQVIIIPDNLIDYSNINRLQNGEQIRVVLETVPDRKKRSLEQLHLYWAACTVFAENTEDENWKTKENVDDQCRILSKFIEPESVKYIEMVVDGKPFRFKHFRTKSISYDECEHLDACGYFTDAFRIQAEKMKMEVEDWIKFVQSKMKTERA